VGRLPARSGTAPTGRRPGRAPAVGRGKKGGSAGERRRRAGRPRLRARCPRGASRLGPLAVSESSASGGAAPRPQWNGSDRTASESRSCGGTGKGTRGGRRRRAGRPRLRARRPRGSSSAWASGSFRVECPRWYGPPPAAERLRPDGVRVARLRRNGEENTGERRRRAGRPRLRARCPRGSGSARASGSFRVECPR